MKRLMISLAVAISLTVGIAGSAAATSPDTHACTAVTAAGGPATHGITGLAAAGGCQGAHAP